MAGRGPGRPVGSTNKRKSDGELSNNPHTKKARDRKANMSETEKVWENAKNALNQAIRRAKGKLVKRDDWASLDDATKKRLEEENVAECHSKSMIKGTHPDQLQPSAEEQNVKRDALGLREDNNDPNWEDISDELDEDDSMLLDMYEAFLNVDASKNAVVDKEQDIQTGALQIMEKQREAEHAIAFSEAKKILVTYIEIFAYKIRLWQNDHQECIRAFKNWLEQEQITQDNSITGLQLFTTLELQIWKLLCSKIQKGKLSRTSMIKRIYRCTHIKRTNYQKRNFLFGCQGRAEVAWKPTLAYLIRLICGLLVNASLLMADFLWETFPGPANIWDKLAPSDEASLVLLFAELDEKKKLYQKIKRWLLAGARVKKAPLNFPSVMDNCGLVPE
ncbi:hypothetical protein PT974_01978 [Cladobotryum mycophilum]|uniref:Uncharacterized protein n=1 Tax=Cladobotryum mycophilum TaxID=491253 RepID=A0ABR0SWT4_9HYPO